ncbi:biorientation of chromosomes in cell division 1-like 1 [Brachionus plicatilis]|uniref:Biorientation of chromosomes in cell division 1-like 1 n=1 Tax=Brachionus plicatilis TaxID=10195 RepID=A0A3M7PJ50_BRAPC|nr:biorientation of chromosomes in cell division 1-like 1 [Brachionus plicatilis]
MDSSHNQQNLKPVVSDVIKEFKADGHFDRLRKDCFSEITSQQLFKNLNKNIEDYVKKFLEDQEKLGIPLRKNDTRDTLRRKLYENISFNEEITNLINQAIDSKKDSSLKPLVDSIVEKIVKPNESENDTKPRASFIPEHIAFTPVQDIKPTPPKTESPVQTKISVEDFLSGEKMQCEKSRKISESDKKPKAGEELETARKDEKSTKNSVRPRPIQTKKPAKQHLSSNDTKLEIDPTQEYNFDWKLDQEDSRILDDISVSNVNTSDLSELESD